MYAPDLNCSPLLKVLVFSQSLLSLDLIEDFLSREDRENERLARKGELPAGQLGTWAIGKDYYRSELAELINGLPFDKHEICF